MPPVIKSHQKFQTVREQLVDINANGVKVAPDFTPDLETRNEYVVSRLLRLSKGPTKEIGLNKCLSCTMYVR